MGGMSSGTLTRGIVRGRECWRLQGEVSLENNGGFLQTALDLVPGSGTFDACTWTGVEIDVLGNGEPYNCHLRTADVCRPWQSYRATFVADPDWKTVWLPFSAFEAHRIDAPLDRSRLRRLGIVAIGRAFTVDIAVADIRFRA